MATHKIGKLKFNLSRHGFAYRWGEGDIKRIAFGKDDSAGEGREAYDASGYPYGEDPYGDTRADDSDYRADDYAPDEGYEPEGAQDGYYEDEDGYYRDGEPRTSAGPVMEYIENNAWVVLALLAVLPPLGIYLLWRLNRYDLKVRAGLSAVAAVWFIVLLILIFSNLFGGWSDTSTPPQMTLVTTAPTAAPTEEPSAAPTSELGVSETLEPGVSPSPTPLANLGDTTSGDVGTDETLVYSPQTGLYYHSDPNCSNIETGVSITAMTVAAARNRNQTSCPVCIGAVDDTVYYGTADGKWYHTDKFCQGMKNAISYTKSEAEAEGKTPCPVCAGGTSTGSSSEGSEGSEKSASEKYLASIKNDKSGVYVYMTSNGTYFHTKSNCSGMSGAKKVTLLAALQSGKSGCPTCAAGANKKVYATEPGTYYHTDPTCSGMKNAKNITLSAALVLGKKKCPVCVKDDFYSNSEESTDNAVYVYATSSGKYYHTNSTCSGMTGAEKVTLLSMLKDGRAACPICATSAARKVYVSEGGKYYHSYATCSGMTDAKDATLAQALAYGFTACPKCWSAGGGDGTGGTGDGTGGTGDGAGSSDDGNSGYSGVYVYATENGKYYHTKTGCSQIDEGATKVLLEQAIDDGKTACPVCAASANESVYAQKGNAYYHKTATCSGMTNAVKGTLAEALVHGLKKCPVCWSATSDGTTPTSSKTYESGTSGIDVYATVVGKYYHTKATCKNVTGTATKIALETALNYGKSACPACAASADKTVYATKGGKYYHYSSSCAGSSASKGTLDQALAYGFKPCPNCVTGTGTGETPTNSGRFTSGTSGMKVYVTATGKYFHTKSNCGGMTGAKYVTLETALNYSLTACPDCAAAAAKKVYAVSGSTTYHYDAACAGSGAVSGTLAEALGYGLKPCPICVTGTGNGGDEGGDEGEESSAPGDTTVYVDLSGDSSSYLYHTSSKCEDTGMKNGTAVTLQYALEHGFGDCGYCNPPTSISDQ